MPKSREWSLTGLQGGSSDTRPLCHIARWHRGAPYTAAGERRLNRCTVTEQRAGSLIGSLQGLRRVSGRASTSPVAIAFFRPPRGSAEPAKSARAGTASTLRAAEEPAAPAVDAADEIECHVENPLPGCLAGGLVLEVVGSWARDIARYLNFCTAKLWP